MHVVELPTPASTIPSAPPADQEHGVFEFRLTRMPKAGSLALPTRQEAVIDALGGQVPPDVEILDGDVRDSNPEHHRQAVLGGRGRSG